MVFLILDRSGVFVLYFTNSSGFLTALLSMAQGSPTQGGAQTSTFGLCLGNALQYNDILLQKLFFSLALIVTVAILSLPAVQSWAVRPAHMRIISIYKNALEYAHNNLQRRRNSAVRVDVLAQSDGADASRKHSACTREERCHLLTRAQPW